MNDAQLEERLSLSCRVGRPISPGGAVVKRKPGEGRRSAAHGSKASESHRPDSVSVEAGSDSSQ